MPIVEPICVFLFERSCRGIAPVGHEAERGATSAIALQTWGRGRMHDAMTGQKNNTFPVGIWMGFHKGGQTTGGLDSPYPTLIHHPFFATPCRGFRIAQSGGFLIPLGGLGAVGRDAGAVLQSVGILLHALGVATAGTLGKELHG